MNYLCMILTAYACTASENTSTYKYVNINITRETSPNINFLGMEGKT